MDNTSAVLIILTSLVIFYAERQKKIERKKQEELELEERKIENEYYENEDEESYYRRNSWKHENIVTKSLTYEQIEKILEQHEKIILEIKDDPDSVRKKREELDKTLNFCERIRQFIEDLRANQSQYEKEINENQTPNLPLEKISTADMYEKAKLEESKYIKPGELVFKNFSCSILKTLVKDFNDHDNIIEYSSSYKFFAILDNSYDKYTVLAFEQGHKLVFRAELYHTTENRYYKRSYLASFKPGLRTKHLLCLCYLIHIKEQERTNKFREDFKEKRTKENEKNFVD